MSGFNLPPGVTADMIPGNEPTRRKAMKQPTVAELKATLAAKDRTIAELGTALKATANALERVGGSVDVLISYAAEGTKAGPLPLVCARDNQTAAQTALDDARQILALAGAL